MRTRASTPVADVQQAVPDGEPPRPPLAQPQRVGHHDDDRQVDDDVRRRPGQPGHRAERAPPGEEQHDELGQADREQATEGEHAGLAARARPESRFHAEQPLPDEEPDADRDRVGDVGQRALEQERDGDVEPQRRPHPQTPGRAQRRGRHGEDGERAGGEADVAHLREGHRPRPRGRREGPDQQRRQQDPADLAGDGRDRDDAAAQPHLAGPHDECEHDQAAEVLAGGQVEEPAGQQRPDLPLAQPRQAVGDLVEPRLPPDGGPHGAGDEAHHQGHEHHRGGERHAPQCAGQCAGEPRGPHLERDIRDRPRLRVRRCGRCRAGRRRGGRRSGLRRRGGCRPVLFAVPRAGVVAAALPGRLAVDHPLGHRRPLADCR